MAYPVANLSGDSGVDQVEVFNAKRFVQWDAVATNGGTIDNKNPFVNPSGSFRAVWLIAMRSVLSFAIMTNQFSADFLVELSHNGGTTFFQAYAFPISGEGIMDVVSDFPLTGGCARFTLAGNVAFVTSGWLEVRAL